MWKDIKIVSKIRMGFAVVTAFTLIVCVIALGLMQGGINVEQGSSESITIQLVVVAFMICAVVTGILVTTAVTRSFNKSVKQLRYVADEMVKGNCEIQVGEINNDELGVIVGEFSNVIDETRKHAKLAGEIARGNLDVEATIKSDSDILGHALKELVDDNNSMLLGIKESSMQLTSGAGQVASASQALAQGSTEQASAIEQITASMTDIARDINANAEITTKSDAAIKEMVERAVMGNDQMKEMKSSMHAIQAASHSISKVIKTIDDIAFQTNILALNATVEAARAGVHGKGFAVVAEEVKNLAEKSAAAAQETAELIQSSIEKVEEGTKLADNTAEALDKTVDGLKGCIEQLESIATACNQQATAVAQINQALNQVSQVVQTNSATSEECASASEELSNQAMALRNMISKYKLSNKGGRNYLYENSFGQTSEQAFDREVTISLDGGYGKY